MRISTLKRVIATRASMILVFQASVYLKIFSLDTRPQCECSSRGRTSSRTCRPWWGSTSWCSTRARAATSPTASSCTGTGSARVSLHTSSNTSSLPSGRHASRWEMLINCAGVNVLASALIGISLIVWRCLTKLLMFEFCQMIYV